MPRRPAALHAIHAHRHESRSVRSLATCLQIPATRRTTDGSGCAPSCVSANPAHQARTRSPAVGSGAGGVGIPSSGSVIASSLPRGIVFPSGRWGEQSVSVQRTPGRSPSPLLADIRVRCAATAPQGTRRPAPGGAVMTTGAGPHRGGRPRARRSSSLIRATASDQDRPRGSRRSRRVRRGSFVSGVCPLVCLRTIVVPFRSEVPVGVRSPTGAGARVVRFPPWASASSGMLVNSAAPTS
jgi:hypothetical protein